MAKFEFGFEESWLRLIVKKLPGNPDLFQLKSVEKAQAILRVGKVKVSAARAWAESAGIIFKNGRGFSLTALGKIIARHDPDLEENGIWWALHYNLAKQSSPAWFYSYYFNKFDADAFDRASLEDELRTWWDETHEKPMTDSVFDKLIFSPFKQVFEGTRFGQDFGLFAVKEDGTFLRQPKGSQSPPGTIIAYALLDWAIENQRQSAHLERLFEPWGIAKIFRLDRETFDEMLIDIGEIYQKKIAWISHTAGLNSVSIMDIPPLALVSAYYHELDGEEPMAALIKGQDELKNLGKKKSLPLFS
jgi:hypothetical protein